MLVKRILDTSNISSVERQCIEMRFLDQLEVVEISKRLAMNKKSVYNNIQRAIKKLRTENGTRD